MIHTFQLSTGQRDEMIDITEKIAVIVKQGKIQEGIAIVYCPHTTAGIAINENADPDVVRDVLMRLNEVYPWEHPKYRHMEGNTASHLKAIMTGTSQTVLVTGGRLLLGRWQGIYLCEFDGPRQRTVHVKLLEG